MRERWQKRDDCCRWRSANQVSVQWRRQLRFQLQRPDVRLLCSLDVVPSTLCQPHATPVPFPALRRTRNVQPKRYSTHTIINSSLLYLSEKESTMSESKLLSTKNMTITESTLLLVSVQFCHVLFIILLLLITIFIEFILFPVYSIAMPNRPLEAK